jgi:hypothetical protein
VIARMLDRKRICFFENGVVSLNLPPVGQVVGARATRTTHPQALAGFRRVLSAVFGKLFDISNPYAWMTKSEIIGRTIQNRCGDLIRDTRSCTRVHAMTNLHTHCGSCSQCIDRRFAVLAAGQEDEDPTDAYKIDLLLGERGAGPDREMALSFVRSASRLNQMTEVAFFAHYAETSRIFSCFEEPATTVAGRVIGLYRRHAKAVCDVFDEAIRANASKMREGNLPSDCLLSLVVSGGAESLTYAPSSAASAPPSSPDVEIRISIDETGGRVIFGEWGDIRGVGAALIMALAAPFRDARENELPPERYPFLKPSKLIDQLGIGSHEVLRRRVFRCRNAINKLAKDACDVIPSGDAVIENSQWHGYRLNPDRVRLVALSSDATAL